MNPCNSCEKELMDKLLSIERDTKTSLNQERYNQKLTSALYDVLNSLLTYTFITAAIVVSAGIYFILSMLITFFSH